MTTTTTSTTTTSPTTTAYNLCQLDPSDPCANHASQVEYCAQLEDMATFMDVGIFCIMDGLTNCCPVVCKVEGCTPPPTTTTTTTTDPSVTTFLCDTSDCSSNSAKGYKHLWFKAEDFYFHILFCIKGQILILTLTSFIFDRAARGRARARARRLQSARVLEKWHDGHTNALDKWNSPIQNIGKL